MWPRTARMRAVGVATIVAASVCTLAAYAGFTSMTVATEPITVGYNVVYTANTNGADGPPSPATWSFRATEGGNQGPWVYLIQQGFSLARTESKVGGFSVRCQATFANTQQQLHEIIRSVSVSGPDRDLITGGLNVNSNMEHLFVYFQVLNGSVPIGPQVAGVPEERIRRPDLGIDTGFVGPSSDYYLANDSIVDHKTFSVGSPGYAALAVGAVFDDFYQQNRMRISDGFGVDQFFYFPERHFQRVKVNNTTWKLVEAQ